MLSNYVHFKATSEKSNVYRARPAQEVLPVSQDRQGLRSVSHKQIEKMICVGVSTVSTLHSLLLFIVFRDKLGI